MIKYHVKYDKLVNPEELKEHPKNVNKHPESQISALTKYIEYTGWRDVITVSNLSGHIVKGHARKLASIRLGCKAPVVYQDFADEAEERSLLLLDNHLAELAEIDVEAKNLEILALQEYDMGEYSLDDFGLNIDIYDNITDNNNDADHDINRTNPVVLQSNCDNKFKVENGDVFKIGKFGELICCDYNDFIPKSVNILIWDPEWDIEFKIPKFNTCLSFSDGYRFKNMIHQCGVPSWVFCWDCVSSWYTGPNRPLKRVKYAAVFGSQFKYNGEVCRVKEWNNPSKERTVSNTRGSYKYKETGSGPHLTDLYQYPITKLHSGSESHNHSKPIDWVRALIGNCTSGDIFDPFTGSGASFLSAFDLGRKICGFEKNIKYINECLYLIQDSTGVEILKIGNLYESPDLDCVYNKKYK